jgi:hypothetical protein
MSKGYRNIDRSVKEDYLEWLMTPPAEREPSTKTEVAEQLGVAISTLWRWEQEPEFQEELRSLRAKWGIRFHADILARLMTIVQEGTDTAAIQASKVLLPHIDTGPKPVSEEDISDEELRAIARALNEQGYATREQS